VNLSKGGFPFAAAKYLPDSMAAFEKEVLSALKKTSPFVDGFCPYGLQVTFSGLA